MASNYEKYFGTPEKVESFLIEVCEITHKNHVFCALYNLGYCRGIECSIGVRDSISFLDWLKEESE